MMLAITIKEKKRWNEFILLIVYDIPRWLSSTRINRTSHYAAVLLAALCVLSVRLPVRRTGP